jgi:hypothetical protein
MTENGNVTRLSLTDIYVLDPATAIVVLHRMQQRREEESKIARQELETREAELKKLTEDDVSQEEVRREYEVYKKRVEAGDIDIGFQLKVPPLPRSAYLVGKQIAKMGIEAQRGIVRHAESLASHADIKDTIALAKTTSDVDGKFTMEIPSDAILFAYGHCDIADETEYYCWLVKEPPKTQLILLTNKNTIDTSAPENFAANR